MHRFAAAFAALASVLLTTGTPAAAPQVAEAAPPAAVEPPPPPIEWQDFGPQVLEAATATGRLILLYISAPWEYHDHVMSEFTYSDPEVAKVVAAFYVPVKVHTDRRPDLFARYGLGGWPTTTVLLQGGLPFFHPSEDGSAASRAGGTFFPPDRLAAYLRQLSEYYDANGEMVRRVSLQVAETLLQTKNVDRGEVRGEALEAVIGKLLDRYGARAAFPETEATHPDFSMVDLAIYYWFRRADREVVDLALHHLTDMARGGIHDRLGGGFFRYARDRMFLVPAFEKLPSTNALAIRAYLRAYEVSGNGIFLRIAEGTLGHVTRNGWSPANRSFLGAQAAWSGESGGLDYYTWTTDEARAVLTEEEFKIASAAYDLGETGELADTAPRRNVIFVARGPKLLARLFEMDADRASEMLEKINGKLLAAREKRPAPAVDPTTYGDWSGMMASAFLHAAATMKRGDLARTATEALEVLVGRCADPQGLISHVCRPDLDSRSEEAFLSDQVRVAAALLDAYELTADRRLLDRARMLVDRTTGRFRDPMSGGFSDRPPDLDAPGLLAWPVRDLDEDMVLVESLLRLHYLTGEATYREVARRSLEAWADEYGDMGVAAAPYALASQKYLNPPLEILVVLDPASKSAEGDLQEAARLPHPWKVVRHYGLEEGRRVLSEEKGLEPLDGPQVVLCYQKECAGPFRPDGSLRAEMDAFLNRGGEDRSKAGAAGAAPRTKGGS